MVKCMTESLLPLLVKKKLTVFNQKQMPRTNFSIIATEMDVWLCVFECAQEEKAKGKNFVGAVGLSSLTGQERLK